MSLDLAVPTPRSCIVDELLFDVEACSEAGDSRWW
jgi:hypothetical protein